MIGELLRGVSNKPPPLIVGRLVLHDDERVATWVAQRVPALVGRFPNRMFAAIGVIDAGLELIAAVVFHNYVPNIDVEATMAADTPRWARPDVLRGLFAYPFQTLGVKRMTCLVNEQNARCRRFVEGIGFRIEGVHDLAFDGVEAMISYGLLKQDLQFPPRNDNGQKGRPGGSSAA